MNRREAWETLGALVIMIVIVFVMGLMHYGAVPFLD
jgi:hypothetical protein